MKISLNWIKDYVDIPKNISPKKLGELLTAHSVEVEEVVEQASEFDNMVVGKILEISQHPNADRLKLVKVDVGQKDSIQVVCGGTNLEENMMIAFAKLGAKVKWHGQGDLITLEKAKIRGEVSEGMICASCEIGLGEYIEGDTTILDLAKHLAGKKIKQGELLSDILEYNDVIIDIDNKTITNRPDLWGHEGIAREISVITKTKLKPQNFKDSQKNKKTNADLSVVVENTKLCGRYMGVVIDNIKIEPSPEWLQKKLVAIGVKPINNIVDITNYIMFDLGQPMHAFDYKKIANSDSSVDIVVRTAKDKEVVTTLDKVERKLDKEMLVIANKKKVIAIAGVMGCENSEVDNSTTKILLESANFEAVNNRQTSTKLGLRTESVMRFEKSLDPNLAEKAIIKAQQMIKDIIPESNVASKLIDKKEFKLNQGPIKLNLEYIQNKIGAEISEKEIKSILESLGFEIKVVKKNKDISFEVKTPSWRATKDVTMKDDLVEEIARIYGYDKLAPQMPKVDMVIPELNKKRQLERKIKNILCALGFNEVLNYPMISEEQVKKMGDNPEDNIKILNVLSNEHAVLRQSLVGNIFVNIKNNLRYFEDFKIFEYGSVFTKEDGEDLIHPDKKDRLPKQDKNIVGTIANLNLKDDKVFFQVKQAVENLLTNIEIDNYEILPANGGAEIKINNQKVGQIFIPNKKLRDNFDIPMQIGCAVFEVDFTKLSDIKTREVKYKPLSKFPETKIDLAIIVPNNILWYNIEKEIKQVVSQNLKRIELFDVYQGKGVEDGKKSLAMHLSFGETNRTMEMKEVESLREKIVKHLNNKFGINIRS